MLAKKIPLPSLNRPPVIIGPRAHNTPLWHFFWSLFCIQFDPLHNRPSPGHNRTFCLVWGQTSGTIGGKRGALNSWLRNWTWVKYRRAKPFAACYWLSSHMRNRNVGFGQRRIKQKIICEVGFYLSNKLWEKITCQMIVS